VGSVDPALPPAITDAVRGLVAATDNALQQLGDEEAGADLEELALVLRRLDSDARALLALMPDHPQLQSACGHLREACDLIDDGMPADAAAFEVLAARARMEASLKPG
jgi:hypothetical protein